MSWDTVVQVLILLAAGTGAMEWMNREPRPIIVKAPVDPIQASLEGELDKLSKARDELLREHAEQLGNGLTYAARGSWDGAMALTKRIDVVRQELMNPPAKG